MLGRALDNLDANFRALIQIAIGRAGEKGIKIIPYCGLRDPFEQARLWRRSRTTAAISVEIETLVHSGAPFLAHALDSVGPQPMGPWATNAIPGLSWHQWGEAVDCYIEDADGIPDWGSVAKYQTFAQECVIIGLVPGMYWQQQDMNHIQYRLGQPLDKMSIREVDAEMEKRFGHV